MMNPHVIREELFKHKNERVLVKIFGMRNKNDSFIGVLKDISLIKLLEIVSFIFSENEDFNIVEDLSILFGKGELIGHI